MKSVEEAMWCHNSHDIIEAGLSAVVSKTYFFWRKKDPSKDIQSP